MNEAKTVSQDHVHSDRSIQHVIRLAAVRILYGAILFLFIFRLFTWILVSLFYPASTDLALHAVRFDHAIRQDFPMKSPWFITSGFIALVRILCAVPFEYRMPATHVLDDAVLIGFFVAMAFWSYRVFSTLWPAVVGTTYLISRLLEFPTFQLTNRDWFAAMFAISGVLISGAIESRRAAVLGGTLWMIGLQFRPQTVLLLPCLAIARLSLFAGNRPVMRDVRNAIADTMIGLSLGFVLVNVPLWFMGGFPAYYVDTLRFMIQGGHGGQGSIILLIRNFAGLALSRNDLHYVLLIPALLYLCTWCGTRQCIWLATTLYLLFAATFWTSGNTFLIWYHRFPMFIAEAVALGTIVGCFFVLFPGLNEFPRILVLVLSISLALQCDPIINVPKTINQANAKIRNHDYSSIALTLCKNGSEFPQESWKMDPAALRAFFEFLGSNVDSEKIPAEIIDTKTLNYPVFLKNPGVVNDDTSWYRVRNSIYLEGRASFLEQFRKFEQGLKSVPDAFVLWVPADSNQNIITSADLDITREMHTVFETIRTHYEPVARFGEVEIRRKKPVVGTAGP